ncbi:hypothetical protein D3C72_2418150 [compost metagenome]
MFPKQFGELSRFSCAVEGRQHSRKILRVAKKAVKCRLRIRQTADNAIDREPGPINMLRPQGPERPVQLNL